MTLVDFIKTSSQQLHERCVDKQISFKLYKHGDEIKIFCTFVEVKFEDNEFFILFTDDKGKKYGLPATAEFEIR